MFVHISYGHAALPSSTIKLDVEDEGEEEEEEGARRIDTLIARSIQDKTRYHCTAAQ